MYAVHQRWYLAIQQEQWSRVIVDVDAPDFLPEITVLDRKNAFPAQLFSLDRRPHSVRRSEDLAGLVLSIDYLDTKKDTAGLIELVQTKYLRDVLGPHGAAIEPHSCAAMVSFHRYRGRRGDIQRLKIDSDLGLEWLAGSDRQNTQVDLVL